MDVSVIQLVGPRTSREEFESLYYEVYKLWRLPGSPPREPGLVAEVVASLEDCQGWVRGEMPQATGEFNPTEVWSTRSRTPRRGRRDASVERSLAKAREAHQKALATVAALEEEIEWLSFPSSGASLRHEPIPKPGTAADIDPRDRRGDTTRCGGRTAMLPASSTTLPRGVQNPKVKWRPWRISI